MKLIIILILLILIGGVIAIFIVNAYNKLSTIYLKITNSNEKIRKNLIKKYETMDKVIESAKKLSIKKNYFKDFESINIDEVDNYVLDNTLYDTMNLIYALQEDFKELRKKDIIDLINAIKEFDHKIIASKKYFNKNNNLLMKNLKGYYKIVANFAKIESKRSYELKEPINDRL